MAMKIHPCALSLDFIELVRRALALPYCIYVRHSMLTPYMLYMHTNSYIKRLFVSLDGILLFSTAVAAAVVVVLFLSMQMKHVLMIRLKQ